MTAEPSFTQVAARRTLAKDPLPPQETPKKKKEYPPSLLDYVTRAFSEFNKRKDEPAFSGILDADIRAALSKVIMEVDDSPIIYERDWKAFPLPHQILLEARQQAALFSRQQEMLTNPEPTASLQNPLYATNTDPTASLQNPLYATGAGTRKRKSPDQNGSESHGRAVTPPWKKKNTMAKLTLADRVTGAAGKSKNQDKKRKETTNTSWFDTSSDALERRRQRFGQISSDDISPISSPRIDVSSHDAHAGPIIGTCQTLEKNYFRLTAPPIPSSVRPVPVLEKTLALIIDKWRTDKDYTYVCDQLKSLRQDLTVQRIKTAFTIKVYEVHARIALQMKDLGEYNQCQTQLRALYKMRLGENGGSGGEEDEFLAYRILYLIYTRNRVDMNNMLAELTPADKNGPFVQLALQVRKALASGNYHKFFQLYNDSHDTGMVPYLMDMFVARERLAALAAMGKAYKPDVNSEFVARELAFHIDSPADSVFDNATLQACLAFICQNNGENLLQEKDGSTRFLTGKAGNILENAKRAAFGMTDIKGQI
ncbi:unnamed protein product [Zymoseptoria tritici ST99CH_1E4]|uniref:SAC3/GANP/THP3 conserved domain-containing protein n=1 Tax=Zymoseptoria tritici ST99CH_1E4 TaxID=1276532 RepID=A0A2H1GC99_ZYMTR|nr:unnamed protein product [Zymoseptoria tritici ST99CH_1E4]